MSGKKYIHKGVRSPERKNFYDTCFGDAAGRAAPKDQIDAVCRECRNPECERAGSSMTAWQIRMRDQPNYLLNFPKFSDLTTDDHKRITSMTIREEQPVIVLPSFASWEEPLEPDVEKIEESPVTVSKPEPKPPEPVRRTKPRNVPIPNGGILIGEGPSPETTPPAPPEDPWVNADKIVEIVQPGATIRLK